MFSRKKSKKLLFLAVVLLAGYMGVKHAATYLPGFSAWTKQAGTTTLQDAYNKKLNNIQLHGEGVVVNILADDLKGSRHQKFIARVGPKQTVLVTHNIDLAPRVRHLKQGDNVSFYGQYEWNVQGGIIHWTHHDPGGRHVDGWLRHNGKTFK